MAWVPEPVARTAAEIREAAAKWRAFASEMDAAAETERRRGDHEASATRARRAAEARTIAAGLEQEARLSSHDHAADALAYLLHGTRP